MQLCSFCKTIDKTQTHLWNQLRFPCEDELSFLPQTPQNQSLDRLLTDFTNNFSLINHLLLIFRFFVYSAREKNQFNILLLKYIINKIKDLEIKIIENEPRKLEK